MKESEEIHNYGDEIPPSFIVEDNISLDTGIETLCIRERRVIYLGIRDGRRVIFKGITEELRNHPEEIAALRKEYLLSMRLDITGVVKIFGFEQHPHLGHVIVMEYIDGTPLHLFLNNRNKTLPKLNIRKKIAFSLATTLSEVHKAGSCHRDLKPDNILIDKKNFTPTIIDFGNGDSQDFLIYKDSLATDKYGSPEQQQPSKGGPESDVYSFGVILKELLPEFRFKRLRNACLRLDPGSRPSIESVASRLDPKKNQKYLRITVMLASLFVILTSFSLFIPNKMNTPLESPKKKGNIRISTADTIHKESSPDNPDNKSSEATTQPAIEGNLSSSNFIPSENKNDNEKSTTTEKESQSAGGVKEGTEYGNILNTYIQKSDKIIARYGEIPPGQEYFPKTMKRSEELKKASNEMKNLLETKGYDQYKCEEAYHTLWTHNIHEINKIDKAEEYTKKAMELVKQNDSIFKKLGIQ